MFLKLIPNLKDRGTINNDGFQPLYGYYKGQKIIYDNDSITTDDDKIEEFRKIIKLCKDKNIKLTIVTSPFYADYKKQTSTTLFVKQICEEEGIEYFNFLNDRDFNDISIFHTVDHLNAIGADRFTKKIAEKLKYN